MTRAISLDGLAPAKPEPRKSFRSADGSDLPSRVDAALAEYREALQKARVLTGRQLDEPRHVYLGRVEWRELMAIINGELSPAMAQLAIQEAARAPINLVGLRVHFDGNIDSGIRIV